MIQWQQGQPLHMGNSQPLYSPPPLVLLLGVVQVAKRAVGVGVEVSWW